MNAKPGDRLRVLERGGVVEYATASSVRVRLGADILDVHYPCEGPYRVLLNLTSNRQDRDPEELEELRCWAFKALRIPEEESWEMHVGLPPMRSVRSGRGNSAALPSPARRYV